MPDHDHPNLLAMRRGDHAAAASLWADHAPRLLGLARLLLPASDRHLAPDAVQNAFLQRLDDLAARGAAEPAPPLPDALGAAVHARRPRPWLRHAAIAAGLALAVGALYLIPSPAPRPLITPPIANRARPDTFASLHTALRAATDPLSLPLRDLPAAATQRPLIAGDLRRLSISSLLEH